VVIKKALNTSHKTKVLREFKYDAHFVSNSIRDTSVDINMGNDLGDQSSIPYRGKKFFSTSQRSGWL
jgi:hypothetical protein